MIDHFKLPVSDLEGSRRFYEGVLAHLGFRFLLPDGAGDERPMKRNR